MKFKRIFTIVADSVGVGHTKDAHKYGDEGANTIGNMAIVTNGLNLPTLETLGIGNLTNILGVEALKDVKGYFGKADELSAGKDTLTGHFELMGLKITEPYLTFTKTGFPKDLIDKLEEQTGYKIIGNIAASGTEILTQLGEEHLKTKAMIVYTSADSVLQIACHEEFFGLEELYKVCKIAREICMDPKYMVARIIARPFLGDNKDNFTRTSNRHDYSLNPPAPTVLDALKKANFDVIAVGKIYDIFNGNGITKSYSIKSNADGINRTLQIVKEEDFTGLCFINLVDFDSNYGHRRDPFGYKQALEEFDAGVKQMIDNLKEDDLLIITADHGNDPTWKGTDHTREMVPVLVYGKKINSGDLGLRTSFADIGCTIAENFNIEMPSIGKSFLKNLK